MARHSYVSLVVVGVDMASGQKYIVCDNDGEIPYASLEDCDEVDLITVAKEQFGRCSLLSPNWVQISIVAAVMQDPDIDVIYTCQIPLDTALSGTYTWKKVSEAKIDDIVIEAVLSAVRGT